MNKQYYLIVILVVIVLALLAYIGSDTISDIEVEMAEEYDDMIEEIKYNATQLAFMEFTLELTRVALDCNNQPIPLDIRLYKQVNNVTELPDMVNLVTLECGEYESK